MQLFLLIIIAAMVASQSPQESMVLTNSPSPPLSSTARASFPCSTPGLFRDSPWPLLLLLHPLDVPPNLGQSPLSFQGSAPPGKLFSGPQEALNGIFALLVGGTYVLELTHVSGKPMNENDPGQSVSFLGLTFPPLKQGPQVQWDMH